MGCRSLLIFPGKYCYLGLGVIAVVEIVWISYAGYAVNYSSLWPALERFAGYLGILILLNLIHWFAQKKLDHLGDEFANRLFNIYLPAAKTFAGGIVYLIAGWIVLRLFNHLTMTIPISYADPFLAGLDGYLPFNWNAYFEMVATTPWLIRLFDEAYTSLTFLSILAFIILVCMGKLEHSRFFVITFTITAVVCTVLGMFFPAQAAVEFALENKELLNNFPYPPGLYSVPILEQLRSGSSLEFDFRSLPGLTTFPSFHTAAGIVLIYAFRSTFLFWPILSYSIVMIASTPIFGGHYFVDLILGTVIAVIVCRMVEACWFEGVYNYMKPDNSSNTEVLNPAE